MLLTFDVGNTQTVIGVFDEAAEEPDRRQQGEIPGLIRHWRVSTVLDRTADELAMLTRGLIALGSEGASASAPADAGLAHVDGIAISSSVPSLTASMREMAERWFDASVVVVEPGIRTGMPILYENPREVGADRIVNAVAALDLYGGPAIVVDLGTATTFDAISAAGEYLGGAIAPGIEISMDALFEHAAALRRVELAEPRAAIGQSTVESMRSGAIFGYAALVDGLCDRIAAELGGATIVSTGGLCTLISPYTRVVRHIEPWLTLHGLRLLYLRNRTGAAS